MSDNNQTSYKLEALAETEIFVNNNESITIKQVDGVGNESLVILETKERAKLIAKAILKLAQVATFEPEEEENA